MNYSEGQNLGYILNNLYCIVVSSCRISRQHLVITLCSLIKKRSVRKWFKDIKHLYVLLSADVFLHSGSFLCSSYIHLNTHNLTDTGLGRHCKNKTWIKYILLVRAFYSLIWAAQTLKTISLIPVEYSTAILLVVPFKIEYKCQFYVH